MPKSVFVYWEHEIHEQQSCALLSAQTVVKVVHLSIIKMLIVERLLSKNSGLFTADYLKCHYTFDIIE